jgi:DMSO/TMAO reductase YedYZ molybdopterin-dependent catalytic subunit
MISRRQFHTSGAAGLTYGAAGLALAQGSTLRAEAAGSTAPATASRTMRATQLTAFRRPLEIVEIPGRGPACRRRGGARRGKRRIRHRYTPTSPNL